MFNKFLGFRRCPVKFTDCVHVIGSELFTSSIFHRTVLPVYVFTIHMQYAESCW